jgi:hypothetical protein
MMRLAPILSIPVLALVLTATSAAAASDAKPRTFASCKAEGDYATCVAGASTNRPVTIRVNVSATSRQRLSVYWDVVCSKGLGAGGKQGHFTATTPIDRVIPHPYARPDSCTVSADAQLTKSGTLRVWLTATHW